MILRILSAALSVTVTLHAPRAFGQPSPTLVGCQKTIAKESASYARAVVLMVDRCLSKISADVVRMGLTVNAAASREAASCAAAFARLGTTGSATELGARFDRKIGLACDAVAAGPLLGADTLGDYCKAFGGDGAVDDLTEWKSCMRAAADAGAREAIATRWPRALEYFAALAPAFAALPQTGDTVAARSALVALDSAIEGPRDDDQPDPRRAAPGLLATGDEQTYVRADRCTPGRCPGVPDQDGRVRAGYAARLRDNGDGTITDEISGLTWEKLSNDGSIHERSATFSFGDAINVKIAALNADGGFAGHTDWRLPNRRELESLVDAGRREPAIRPIFDDACPSGCSVFECSCTFPDVHWTSTSYQPDAAQRWVVDFGNGEVSPAASEPARVRAVRGGPRVTTSPAPGTGSGLGSASLATCQKTVAKESAKYVRAVSGNVSKCLDRMAIEVVAHGATLPDAARTAGASCVRAFRKIENAEHRDQELGVRFVTRIADRCDPATNPKLSHLEADTWTIGARTLSAARLGAYCAQLGGAGSIEHFADWSACVRLAADAEARQAITFRWPRALEYFAALAAQMATPPVSAATTDARVALVALDARIEGTVDDDRPDPLPDPPVGLLETGQTQCAQPDLTMGACPGGVGGQDGAIRAGVARRYTDNGDTITDDVTGLTWEKLTDDDSINDKDHTYGIPAYSLNKVARLRRHSFGGYDDWRVPNRRELESLVDAGRAFPAIDPIFDHDCTPGCTAAQCSCTKHGDVDFGSGAYISSTTGWSVDFADGRVVNHSDTLVRAVRGGHAPFAPFVNQPPTALDIHPVGAWKQDCILVTMLGTDPDSFYLFARLDSLPQNGFLTQFAAAIPPAFPAQIFVGPTDFYEEIMGSSGLGFEVDATTLCYVPFSPAFTGTDSFTYHVVDNEGLESNVAFATITVAEIEP